MELVAGGFEPVERLCRAIDEEEAFPEVVPHERLAPTEGEAADPLDAHRCNVASGVPVARCRPPEAGFVSSWTMQDSNSGLVTKGDLRDDDIQV
jgi:hypothetical protein